MHVVRQVQVSRMCVKGVHVRVHVRAVHQSVQAVHVKKCGSCVKMVQYVSSKEETAALCSASAERGKKVVLYFTASWCGPCKRIKKPLEQLAAEYSRDIDVYGVDVDEVPTVAELYRVRSMPTFVFCAQFFPF